jgi:amino acid adenylation domain-containing protein
MTDGPLSGGPGTNDALERRLAALSPAKRALFLKQAGLAAPAPAPAGIPHTNGTAPAPLSYGQELLWLVEQATAGTAAYNVHSGLRLRGSVSESAMRRAIDALVARHEVLRTRFPVVGGVPVQVVDPKATATLECADLRAASPSDREEAARAWVRALARRPFDLTTEFPFRAGLARVADDEWWLVLSRHHLVSDGWSQGVLYSDLSALYTAYAAGREPDLPPLQVQYRDFAAWQRNQLQGERLERLLAFWRGQLADASEPVSLPTDFPRPRTPNFEGRWIGVKLPASLRGAVRALGREHNASVFVTMLAAVQAFIHRYAGSRDVVIASPVAGRSEPELAPLIGYFGNTLLFRAQFADDPSFRTLLARGRETTMAAFDHQELPFERLVLDLPPERRAGAAPLFHAMFSFNTGIYAPPAFANLEVRAIGEGIGAAKTDLVFTVAETDDGLNLAAEYRIDLFERATIQRMLANFETMLADAVARPDVPVSRLALVAATERRLMLHDWNDTDAAWPTEATLHGLFEAQVARRPDAIAVCCDGDSVTYAELDRRANRLAWRLRAAGVKPDELVGVCMEKSIDFVTALLGILKAGGAYVPMDPSYPDDRLAFVLEDSEARIVLTDSDLVARLSTYVSSRPVELIPAAQTWSEAEGARDDVPPPSAGPANLCYVIYTSGSTGRPKGVLIEHRNVVRLLFNDRFQFEFSDRDVWTVFHSFSFDFSVWEMYGALLRGGRLVVVPRRVAQDPHAYLALLATERVTVLNQVPSAFYGLMREELSRPTASLGALRYVIFGGEALQPALLRDWKARYPATTLVNMFGITETTVHVTFKVIGDAEIENGASNIGRPIPTLSLYVLDSQLEPVPVGATGELCVGGAGVARGYLQRPELTAERFVAHPFRAGERMYRSGDVGRQRADGEIEYLGRRDAQVKIRGFRIELGEIESVLATHPAVRQAAVVIDGQSDGGQLAGYYVPVPAAGAQAPSAAPLTPASLRVYLRERLPEYMVPAFLVPLDAIPVTANGKLDRASLPSPQSAAGDATPTHMPPRTVHEHQLVFIWEALLDRKPIGIQDDFFDLGGHSLLAVRMLSEIEQTTGRRIPLAALFEDATIERLAARLESAVSNDTEPPVVVLPSAPNAQPFVFLHGDIRGGGWYSRRLAQLLGPKVKLIVLPTIRPGEPSSLTVEAMAERQLTELRKVQPTGPYRIGGFCLGGMIAFEMAQRLRAAGETVERLILINSGLHNPPYRGFRWLIDAILPAGTDAKHVERRAKWLSRATRARFMSASNRWQLFRGYAARVLSRAARTSVEAQLVTRHAQGEIFARPATDIIFAWKLVAAAYLPRPYPAPIDLIVAVDQAPGGDVDPTAAIGEGAAPPRKISRRGWTSVSSDVRLRPVQASFIEVITSHVDALAEHLRACLDTTA